jgi:hypothetical protein
MLMPEKVQEKLWDMQGKSSTAASERIGSVHPENPIENVLNNACTARTLRKHCKLLKNGQDP